MSNDETRTISLWRLKEIANTLRMVSNTFDSPKRKTCLDRNVMRSWNVVVDIIHEKKVSAQDTCKYYTEVGQSPDCNTKM